AALLEIEDLLDRRPAGLSGGQQQRVSLGRALVRDADLHLLDEPMGQLEPQLRAALRGRIKHFLKERGLTTILVTHDQTEANALADRIAVMEEGVLQQFDAPDAIKARPANLFTGAFIGEPPMNLFPARADAGEEQVGFVLGEGATLAYPAAAFAPELRAALAGRPEVTVGVRPHAVRLTEGGERAEVFAAQWLGDQSHVAARFAGGSVVSVTHDRARLAPGQPVGVEIAAEDLHLFDTTTGRALSHGGALA
ncbi:MAG: ABC transporter ATP-binding protein, partial [Pseudomonadota bacterium]